MLRRHSMEAGENDAIRGSCRNSYFDDSGNMEIKTAVTALAALAQETRLSIYRLLVEAGPQGMAAGRIGEKLNVPGATLSFHLKELSRAFLVSARQEKQFIYYAVDFGRMAELMNDRQIFIQWKVLVINALKPASVRFALPINGIVEAFVECAQFYRFVKSFVEKLGEGFF